MKTAGYSGTPLAKKLGLKEGFKIRLVNQPEYYFELFDDLPENIKIIADKKIKKNLIHYFTKEFDDLQKDIVSLRSEIEQTGNIWISCPKKSAIVASNISMDEVRHLALANGLVDKQICAIDEIWSGFKLVIPVKDRISSSNIKLN